MSRDKRNSIRRRTVALSVLLTVLLVTTSLLSGCSLKDSARAESKSSKLQIVTTIFPPYDFARQITGKDADVHMLLKPGEESHSFEPTPQDIRMIQNADLFIYIGGDNDTWVKQILDSMGSKAPKAIRLIDLTSTVAEEETEGMQETPGEHDHEHEEADEHEHDVEMDEHVWTSPKKAAEIVEKLSTTIESLDPAHKADYEKNTRVYTKKLMNLNKRLHQIIDHAKRKEILFADRFPFRYLADELDLKYYAAFSGCSANMEPSARTVAFLTNRVQKDKLPVVFTIEFSNHKMADSICSITGARRLTLYSCHNVTAKQWKNGTTYLSMMNHNVRALSYALNQ